MPVVTRELLDRHLEVANALRTFSLRPHYLPGAWVAHVTLAKDLRSRDAVRAALSAVSEDWTPFDGLLDRADMIYFRPVRLLRQAALRPN
jgi:hypothetical protein